MPRRIAAVLCVLAAGCGREFAPSPAIQRVERAFPGWLAAASRRTWTGGGSGVAEAEEFRWTCEFSGPPSAPSLDFEALAHALDQQLSAELDPGAGGLSHDRFALPAQDESPPETAPPPPPREAPAGFDLDYETPTSTGSMVVRTCDTVGGPRVWLIVREMAKGRIPPAVSDDIRTALSQALLDALPGLDGRAWHAPPGAFATLASRPAWQTVTVSRDAAGTSTAPADRAVFESLLARLPESALAALGTAGQVLRHDLPAPGFVVADVASGECLFTVSFRAYLGPGGVPRVWSHVRCW